MPEEISCAERDCTNVIAIQGIGPMISTAMIAAVGKGEAFDRGRDFTAWLGLLPAQYSTGGRTILGRITNLGSRYLRMLFVQATNVIMMRRARWPDFSFGAWLTGAIALADKPARTAWSILRHGTWFDAPRDMALVTTQLNMLSSCCYFKCFSGRAHFKRLMRPSVVCRSRSNLQSRGQLVGCCRSGDGACLPAKSQTGCNLQYGSQHIVPK